MKHFLMVHYVPSSMYYVQCTYCVLGTKDTIKARLPQAQGDSLNISSIFFLFPCKFLDH